MPHSFPAAEHLHLNLEEGQAVQKYKSQFICILTFLSQYPVTEDYFKKYTCESADHWISIFHVDGIWNHLKFLRIFQQLEDSSLGSWIPHHDEISFKFLANAQEFRHSTFTIDEQRSGATEAIQLLANYVKSIPKASWSATTNSRLIGHIDGCLDAEANMFGDTGQGIAKDRKSGKWLAQFYQEMGRYQEAETLYRLMLGVDSNREHDPTSQHLLEALGILLDLQGNYEEAESVLSRVLSSRIATQGENDVESLRTRENLANCLRNQGKVQEAEQHYLFLLKVYPTFWFSLKNNCALLYWECGYLTDARNIFSTLLSESQSNHGDIHYETLIARHNIGTLCLELGEYQEAQIHLRKSFVGRKKIFGWLHPHTLMSARNLAAAEIELEHYELADKVLSKALNMAQRYRPQEDDITFDLEETVALLALVRGQPGQARILLEDTLAKSAALRGSENPKTLQIAEALAWALEAEEDVVTASLE